MYWSIARRRSWLARVGSLLVIAGIMACESERPPSTFYPVDSLVTAQIKLLARLNARLEKKALLGGKEDAAEYRPADTTAWQKELDIFRQLDNINKPVNRNSYEITDGLQDPGSNLLIREFKCIDEQPIVYLRIYYQGTLARPRKLEALYRETNPMFKSTRQLSMRLDQVGEETVLTAYSVHGGQKMMLSDSVSYQISGKILFD